MTARFVFVLFFPSRGADAAERARLAAQGYLASSGTAFLLPRRQRWEARAVGAKGRATFWVYSQSLVPQIQLKP